MPNTTPRDLRDQAYNRWYNMVQRCTNQDHPDWKNYGARGITVCDRWLASFEDFYADVGDAPDGKSLDRWPDNDRGYEPGNWRWATSSEQNANRRQTENHNMSRKTHCPQGHEYTEDNIYHSNGRRICKTCSKAAALAWYHKSREGVPPNPRVYTRKTHCKNGHQFTEANTYIRKDGSQFCRACNRDRANARYAAERASRPQT